MASDEQNGCVDEQQVHENVKHYYGEVRRVSTEGAVWGPGPPQAAAAAVTALGGAPTCASVALQDVMPSPWKNSAAFPGAAAEGAI